jgi:hypothetical protein
MAAAMRERACGRSLATCSRERRLGRLDGVDIRHEALLADRGGEMKARSRVPASGEDFGPDALLTPQFYVGYASRAITAR